MFCVQFPFRGFGLVFGVFTDRRQVVIVYGSDCWCCFGWFLFWFLVFSQVCCQRLWVWLLVLLWAAFGLVFGVFADTLADDNELR